MRPTRSTAGLALLLGATVLLTGCGGGETARCKTPSGYPVPRFVALKSGEVNARNGPGLDQRILWVWRVRKMPLLVVAESRDWRKVRGPDGGEAWLKEQMVDGSRTAMRAKPGDLPLLAEPKAGARVVAYLRSGAVASQLKAEGGWSKLEAGGESGWAPDAELWGGGPAPECTGVRPPAG
jgi:SH3-like domain-containing protein